MDSSSLLKNNLKIPPLTLNPLSWVRWWLTPRSINRDTAYRERVLRITILIITIFLIMMLPSSFTPETLQEYDSAQQLMLSFTLAFGIIFIASISLHFRMRSLAAWVILGAFIAGSISTIIDGNYWTTLSAIYVLLIAIYSQLILRGGQLWASRFIAILLAISPAVLNITEPDAIELQINSSPNFSAIIVSVGLILIIAMIRSLILEYERSRHELQQFATQLEKRVADRTVELNLAKQEAENANQVKSQFLANMSHELRTPLNAILNFTAFVADGVMGPINDEQADMLNQSIASGNHLLALINDILDITKIEAGLMDLFIQEVDMNEILASIESIGKGLVKDKEIKFISEIDTDLPISFGDKRRLRQVFLNMISNAFKFTYEGSVALRAKKTIQGICVEVQDTGIGISDKDQYLVFQSFKQAKHDFTETIGTGLGMPISKYFVESHRGKMWFESAKGRGTTFYVELPTLTEDEANQANKLLEVNQVEVYSDGT